MKSNMNTSSANTTPLFALSKAICRRNEAQIFCNQVVMYQLFIPFISDQLISFSNQYAPFSVDDLISDIRRYIVYVYENPGQIIDDSTKHTFSLMHQYIYDNIANRDSGITMSPYIGDKSLLSVTELRGQNNLESNISNTIKDRRALPKKCEKILRSGTANYTPILYRCFWLLQYYFVYYERDICTINHSESSITSASSQFIEYFPIKADKKTKIFEALSEYCYSFSEYFGGEDKCSGDLLSLSRIILDVIIEQINLRQKIRLDIVADASLFASHNRKCITELEQFEEFQKYINAFGTDAYDRYNMLLKFAPTNCYAADELATTYYWGKTYWIRDNNFFELEQSYEKAAEWYQKAIENSNPPLQCSCWSLSYTLTNLHYSTEEERKAAEKKAIEYLKLAGEYPAAYNHIAFFLFKDAEMLFSKYRYDEKHYEDILIQFLSAIRLADKAGKMHWFYGNNQISAFMIKHKTDKKLLKDLKARLDLNIPFELEAHLKQAADYHSPWAIKHLALYYLEKNDRTKCSSLLDEAMSSNYNSAFYEAARNLHKTGSAKWKELMQKASALSYPAATYELCKFEKNRIEKKRLALLCKQQILSEKALDTILLDKINSLNI